MLRTAGHVHDLARAKADPAAQVEQKIGVIGYGRFRLRFGLISALPSRCPKVCRVP